MNAEQDHHSGPERRSRWPLVAVALLLVLFGFVLHQRNRIRAHWWAYRLARTEDPEDRAYYVGSLRAVGEKGAGAVAGLARDPDADIRLFSIALLKSLGSSSGTDGLKRLLGDPDTDVREAAALALAFTGSQAATAALCEAAAFDDDDRAAAAAIGLGRLDSPRAWSSLCRSLADHPSPRVRAQAAESLVGHLLAARHPRADSSTTTDAMETAAILALVRALADRSTFAGELAIERSIAGARAFAGRLGKSGVDGSAARTPPPERTVAAIAAQGLSRLTGRVIRPSKDPTPAEQADYADQCVRWYRAFSAEASP